MDKRKKYFQAVAAGVLLIGVGGFSGMAGGELRMNAARMIAGEGMLRLVATQYAGDGSGVRNERDHVQKLQMRERTGTASVESSQDRPRAALTFDDGPNARYTPVLLDGLRERGIHATFFLMGKNIEGKEKIVEQMYRDGHLIGNHTYDHVQLNRIPNDQACQQILKTNNAIYEITGEYPLYLRPPYGAWPKNLELCVTMLPVFWDVDTLDWKSKNVQSVENIVRQEVKDGSIILMHDSYQSSVEAALWVADMLTGKGYDLVTADELLVL